MTLSLRSRVAVSFALLALLVASIVSVSTYAFASWYLLGQRENAALTRATLDSRAVAAFLASGSPASEALDQIPSVGVSQQMVRIDGAWYTKAVTVPPGSLPDSLLEAAEPSGARQRVSIAGDPFFAVAIPVPSGMYVELFPLSDLDAALTWGAWILATLTLFAGLLGAVVGATAFGRILHPVRNLADGARRIASGELGTRIETSGDPDLDPIADAFNDMAQAVEARIGREKRFSANVSHELRSPLTSVLGTAELLEGGRDHLPVREAGLVTVLVQQVRRMSHMLLDLLEISRIGADDPPLWESADLASVCRDLVAHRGLDIAVISGDEPMLRTDARRLERIIGNLIDNAEQHGGGVTGIRVEQDDDVVRVIIDDDGPGVDPDLAHRLFEPFVRGSTSVGAQGAGLGLAIVRDQADVLGGTVTASASPTGGARFIAEFPSREGTP